MYLNFVNLAIIKLQTNPNTMINAITIGKAVCACAVIASEIGVTPSNPKAVENKYWKPFNAVCAAPEPIPKIKKPTIVLIVPEITLSAGLCWINRPTNAIKPINNAA